MKVVFTTILVLLNTLFVQGQLAVTRVYSDFGGFWTSSNASISPISPNNTNHLLAFQTGSTVWSTGVDNTTLTSNGVTFSPQNFVAMPATVASAGGLLGIGSQFGGAGCVAAPFANDASLYISDGVQGLNLATAIFNVGGSIRYTVSNVADFSINDGIPDIIITQVGDYTSGTNDWFRFLDEDNNVVGTALEVNFTSIPKVSNLSWKFFNRAEIPTCGGSTSGNRDFRMIAIDFADLGITAANYHLIRRFEHQLSSRSDIAFVGYNTSSIDILPVELIGFDAVLNNRKVDLIWHTATEKNNALFIVERSLDGKEWDEILFVNGAGNASEINSYNEVDVYPYSGVSYYRLSQIDFDGKHTYFEPVAINNRVDNIEIYPNPAKNILSIQSDEDIKSYSIINMVGQNVTGNVKSIYSTSHFIQLNIESLESGVYTILCNEKAYSILIL